MKSKLFLLLVVITCFAHAQDYKWSAEANYPISIGDDLGNDNPAIVDLGLKYRFLKFGNISLGVGLNAGVFHDNLRSSTVPETFNFDETNWVIQPKAFIEFKIPTMEKLRPSIGLGYAVITSKFDGMLMGEVLSESSTDGGFNLNLGVTYDITKRIFIQVQYDYVRNKVQPDVLPDINQDLGYLKFGVGVRF
ncbi:outer membrane protein [Flagellimonas sp. 2504JD4-2]